MIKRLTIFVALMLANTLWAIPNPPTLISPVNGATNVSTAPLFHWSAVPGVIKYRLQVSYNLSFTSLAFDTAANSMTQMTPTYSLIPGATYYWRVNDSDATGRSYVWSTIDSFTVIAQPPAPVLISPINGAVNVPLLPTFTWNASTGATNYLLQVSTVSDFSSLVFSGYSSGSTTMILPISLVADVYYWRVYGYNAPVGMGASSTIWSFTTVGYVNVLQRSLVQTSPIVSTKSAIIYSLLGRRILSTGVVAKSPSLYIYRTNDRTIKKMMFR